MTDLHQHQHSRYASCSCPFFLSFVSTSSHCFSLQTSVVHSSPPPSGPLSDEEEEEEEERGEEREGERGRQVTGTPRASTDEGRVVSVDL